MGKCVTSVTEESVPETTKEKEEDEVNRDYKRLVVGPDEFMLDIGYCFTTDIVHRS
jgi:hypothetical protein